MHAVRRWRPAILHNGLVVFATALLYGHLFSQLRQGLINRLASPEREGQSPLKLFHPINWIWLEKFSKCGDRGLRADGRAGAQNERMQVRWRRTRRGASGSGLPLSRLPLREGRRPPHAWPSPPLNMAPGPRSLADGPVLRAAEPGRSEAAGRGLLDRRALGRPQLPLSFVCVRVAFSRSEAAA